MKRKKMTLYQKQDRPVRIKEIQGGPGVRRQLAQLGIRVGDQVTIKRNAPFGGPVLLELKGTEIALGRSIAENILVEEIIR